jgi:hypothetical protein
MTTPITPITSIARLARQARAFSLPLLVAGALAAGCGTAAANPGGANEPAAAAGTASSSSSASAPGSAPAASASPVPTVSGGPMIPAGGAACAGWPTNAPHGTLTAFFAPVAVERCVTGFQQIKGKGEWETATLEKSTEDLAKLAAALLRPAGGHQPGIFCPEFAVIPPQIVLINGTGQLLIPRLPVGGCGAVDAQVLSTLETMAWQPLSVRLISRVNPVVAPKTLPGASLAPGSPKVARTGSGTGVMNGQPVSG